MDREWTQPAIVNPGGRIEVVLPTLEEGERVEVTVRRSAGAGGSKAKKRAERVHEAISRMKARAVMGAHIHEDSLRRENLYPDRM